jgi:hypothetical protein
MLEGWTSPRQSSRGIFSNHVSDMPAPAWDSLRADRAALE